MFLLITNIFCLLISYLVIGIYCVYYHAVGLHLEYLDILKVMSLSVLLIAMPTLVGNFLKKTRDNIYVESQYTIVIFLFSTLLGLCSHLLNFNFSSVVIVFGVIVFLASFFVYHKLLIKEKAWIWLMIIFFSIVYAIAIARQYYIAVGFDPLLIQRIIIGRLTIDPIYLGGVANIINTYNIPAWGIDGISYLHYHWGSIWFLAMLASLLNISVIKSYTLLYPAVFLSLMFKALFLFCWQVSKLFRQINLSDKKVLIAMIITVALAISFPYPLSLFQEQCQLGSDSYSLALFFVFLLATIMVSIYKNSVFFAKLEKTDILIVIVEFPIVLFLIGMTKVSVFYDVVLLYFYFLFRAKLYNRTTFFVAGILILFLIGGVYYFAQYGSPVGKIIVHLFDFLYLEDKHVFSYLVSFNRFPFFAHIYNFIICIGHFSIFYFWSWMFFIVKYIHYKLCQSNNVVISKRELFVPSLRYFDIEIVVFLFLINGLIGYSLKIVGGSAFYFLDITRWVSIALFLSVLTKIICFCDKSFGRIDKISSS